MACQAARCRHGPAITFAGRVGFNHKAVPEQDGPDGFRDAQDFLDPVSQELTFRPLKPHRSKCCSAMFDQIRRLSARLTGAEMVEAPVGDGQGGSLEVEQRGGGARLVKNELPGPNPIWSWSGGTLAG